MEVIMSKRETLREADNQIERRCKIHGNVRA